MPTKTEADAWAERHTLGLINGRGDANRPRLRGRDEGFVVTPFELVPGCEHLAEGSRGRDRWSGFCAR